MAAGPAGAGDAPDDATADEVVVVEEDRATVAALPGATLTVIEVGEVSDRVLSLGDLLAASPGVHVTSTGGVGASQYVRLRGANGAQVRILVDGLPVIQDGSGAVDLASLPLEAVERIEVWRGLLPLDLGGEGIGGAINLVTRRPADPGEARATAAAGSFGTLEASAGGGMSRDRWQVAGWTAGQAAENDFPFFSDNGTPYTTADDDPDRRRTNAATRRAEATLRAHRDGRIALALGADGLLRAGGVPGPGTLPLEEASKGEQRALVSVAVSGGGRVEGRLRIAAQGARQAFRNPRGEGGMSPLDLDAHTGALTVDSGVGTDLGRDVHLGLHVGASRVGWISENLLEPGAGSAARSRDRLSGSAQAEARRGRVGLGVGLAVDAARSHADGALPYGIGGSQAAGDVLLVSPQASATLAAAPSFALRASGGRAHRLPTFAELYGANGITVGNDALRPERAWFADAGADLAGGVAGGTGTVSLTGYWRDVEDLVAWMQNSQFTLRAENFDRVRVGGLETGVGWTRPRGSLGRVEASAAWTLTATRNLSDRPTTTGRVLPGQALHVAYADLSAGPSVVRAGITVEAESGTFRDETNLTPLAARAFVHARIEVRPRPRWPRVTLEVRNLLDHRVEPRWDGVHPVEGGEAVQAVTDYAGYPLPGRAFYASLAWSSRKAP
ncbi:MAG: TonB-dependent receptor [Deltaproteobacteria bacterium]|nr:TonB-dependent receptor [Deltaproteobacteria bacterium]